VLDAVGPRPDADVARSLRAQQVDASLQLRPGSSVEGRVLLVDDVLRTGWTVTVAGALLREAGADLVLPLVVHQRP
jgi:ATP-dependent DNA helicase RecQ